MRIFFDTEFYDDGKTIDLISIGLVREDGRKLYLESVEADLDRVDDWMMSNVIPQLTGPRVSRAEMASAILAFVDEAPEFWAWYADRDWVALCQLYGRVIDLPRGWPMYCRDLQQEADRLGVRFPPQACGAHNALRDAEWAKEMFSRFIGRRGKRSSNAQIFANPA